MELKVGYKQTEVGVIPEDWHIQPLGLLTDSSRPISYGIVQTGPNVANGVRCLRVLDIENGRINKSDLITTTREISTSYKRTILKAGDLVMPLRGKVGEVGAVDEDLAGSNLTRGVALIAIRSEWSGLFCRQFIAAPSTRVRLQQAMNGSALQEIPIAALRAFKIALPPTKPEQEAIAEALSDADALIESLDQLIAKKRQMKQGAMQELLTGKRRLPGFEGEWMIKRLGDVAEISKGQLITESTAIPGDVPVIAGGKKPAYFHNRANRTGKTITISGSGASAGYVAFYESPIFASDCSTIGEGGNYSVEFIYFVLLLNQEVIYKAQTGGAQPHIHPDDLRPLMIHVPIDYSEQVAIATILSDVDAELVALESRLAKARQIKQGMMHELLTGRIRLI